MPSEKFSARLSIAARLTPALVERFRVAADDQRHRLAAGCQSAAVERVGDGLDVLGQAFLRQQRCWPEVRSRRSPMETRQSSGLDHKSDRRRHQNDDQQRGDAADATLTVADAVARLSVPSRQDISLPIQVTGWPMARNSRSG